MLHLYLALPRNFLHMGVIEWWYREDRQGSSMAPRLFYIFLSPLNVGICSNPNLRVER